ncbi:hypothetical protein [Streptomyces xanthophaeus]|uniref:hypothetical protein n=1 Tax=Streptomyces xanthophaeus TaxID=67385 RepID=UPI0026470664|nr:hypothetical protein [Streptomyces xanthophaeus]WKD35997.1 hypothetical protein KO717_31320 [Streptomyces xanthophaeus]
MSGAMRARAWAAAGSVVVAALSALVTNLVTDSPSPKWWVFWAVLLVLGIALQIRVSAGSEPVTASGAGSVAVRGRVSGNVSTRVRGTAVQGAPPPPPGDGVAAVAPGAVAADGEVGGDISTDVEGDGTLRS